jgi:hypothetical protein
VTRRIEDVREHLAADGVEGLDGARDTRRPLCEWLLATRRVVHTDVDWLAARIEAARRHPASAPRDGGPSTSQFNQLPGVRVQHAAHTAARLIAPLLQARLVAVHGDDWLVTINTARRSRGMPPARSLDDDRFCLGLLARDDATCGWAGEEARASAAALKALADAAVHNRSLPADAVAAARRHAERIGQWAASLA